MFFPSLFRASNLHWFLIDALSISRTSDHVNNYIDVIHLTKKQKQETIFLVSRFSFLVFPHKTKNKKQNSVRLADSMDPPRPTVESLSES